MARREKHRRSPDEMTPFAQRILRYLQSSYPAVSIPELAEQIGVGRQSIYDWLDRDVIPRPDTIELVARGTGIPARELYAAAGLPTPEELPWLELARYVEQEERLPERAREELLEIIAELRVRYTSQE